MAPIFDPRLRKSGCHIIERGIFIVVKAAFEYLLIVVSFARIAACGQRFIHHKLTALISSYVWPPRAGEALSILDSVLQTVQQVLGLISAGSWPWVPGFSEPLLASRGADSRGAAPDLHPEFSQ